MPRRTHVLVAIVVLASAPVSALAATTADRGAPITVGEAFTLRSEVLDEKRTILVSTPPGYAGGEGRFHVLYLTDGPDHLVHTRGTVDFLARNGLMPQVIIVGIANTERTRDLTPTKPAAHVGVDGRARQVPQAGGADRFLAFLATELIPWVEGRYRTHPYRVLAGHSFGGLLALHALCTRPDLFGGVIAVSPSLRWDDDLVLDELAAFLEDGPAATHGLFVAMADEEAGDPSPTRFETLQRLLRDHPRDDLRWAALHLPGETHGTVVLPSHFEALQMIYDGWHMPRDPVTGLIAGGLPAIEQHYAELSRRYGHAVAPPEAVVNLAGYQALHAGDVAGAIAVFRHNAEAHPGSANVHDSLGEALETAGRLDEARRAYARAVARAVEIGDARADLFRQNLARVEAALAGDGRAH